MGIYKLGDICQIVSGSTPKTGISEYWDGDIKWITPAEINDDTYIITDSVRKITKLAVEKTGLLELPKGTVILSSRAPIGKVAIAGCTMYCNQGFKNFVCTEKINNKYLYWFLKNKTSYLNSLGRGATFKELSKAIVSNIEIDVPDMRKQEDIVDNLERINTIIKLRRRQINALEEITKARFVEMFGDVIRNDRGWPVRKFSDITNSRLGKMLDAKQQTGTCMYPYLANYNVQWFRFELDTLNQMDFNDKDREEFALEDGDLLVCEGGEIGRCAVWHNQVENCYFQKALHRVRCNRDLILPDYLAWWFKYNCENGGFVAIEGAKATISHLTGAKMKDLDVAIPDIKDQCLFVEFIKQVNKSKLKE